MVLSSWWSLSPLLSTLPCSPWDTSEEAAAFNLLDKWSHWTKVLLGEWTWVWKQRCRAGPACTPVPSATVDSHRCYILPPAKRSHHAGRLSQPRLRRELARLSPESLPPLHQVGAVGMRLLKERGAKLCLLCHGLILTVLCDQLPNEKDLGGFEEAPCWRQWPPRRRSPDLWNHSSRRCCTSVNCPRGVVLLLQPLTRLSWLTQDRFSPSASHLQEPCRVLSKNLIDFLLSFPFPDQDSERAFPPFLSNPNSFAPKEDRICICEHRSKSIREYDWYFNWINFLWIFQTEHSGQKCWYMENLIWMSKLIFLPPWPHRSHPPSIMHDQTIIFEFLSNGNIFCIPHNI